MQQSLMQFNIFGEPELQGEERKPIEQEKNFLAIAAHKDLHKIYGTNHEYQCASCKFLIVRTHGHKMFRCAKMSHHAKTHGGGGKYDWRKYWQACGLFVHKLVQIK